MANINELYSCLPLFKFSLITNTREMALGEGESETGCDENLNEEICLGQMRPLNLSQPPFSWPTEDKFTFKSHRSDINATDIKVTTLLRSENLTAS